MLSHDLGILLRARCESHGPMEIVSWFPAVKNRCSVARLLSLLSVGLKTSTHDRCKKQLEFEVVVGLRTKIWHFGTDC